MKKTDPIPNSILVMILAFYPAEEDRPLFIQLKKTDPMPNSVLVMILPFYKAEEDTPPSLS